MAKDIWYLKHRPTSIDDYIFQSEQDEKKIRRYIDEKYIPHLLFSGHRGTGKTTLALLIAHELGIDCDIDLMFLNASDENSVETIRNKVKSFITTMSMSEFRIVFLDEAENLSQAAQETLKSMMEQHADNARFIFSCNRPQKIIPEIRDSRVQTFEFKSLDKLSMVEQLAMILQKEKVKVTGGIEQLEEYVDQAYPDMRKLINLAEQNTINGKLNDIDEMQTRDDDGEVFIRLVDMVENNTLMKGRDYLYENVSGDECLEFYQDFYDNVTDIFATDMGQKKAIVILADHIHRDYFSAIKQATFESCLIKLANVFAEEKKK